MIPLGLTVCTGIKLLKVQRQLESLFSSIMRPSCNESLVKLTPVYWE